MFSGEVVVCVGAPRYCIGDVRRDRSANAGNCLIRRPEHLPETQCKPGWNNKGV